MKIRIVSLIFGLLGLLILGGCSKYILETRYVANLDIYVKGNVSRDFMTVSGTILHSALVTRNIDIKIKGDDLDILIFLRLVRNGESGNFSYTFNLPRNVKTVYFGQSKTRIWQRP